MEIDNLANPGDSGRARVVRVLNRKKYLMLAHIVYFTLEDNSPEQADALVAGCHQYLKNHPGVTFFAAGKLGEEFDRDVNQKDYDVSLHVYFEDKAAHDAYQTVDDHITFINSFKDNWKQVRVFDSYVD